MRHELKTWPKDFEAVIAGRKTHEARFDDRGFAVGDVLRLREWQPMFPSHCNFIATPSHLASGAYLGRSCDVVVTHLTKEEYGLPPGLAIMSIRLVDAPSP